MVPMSQKRTGPLSATARALMGRVPCAWFRRSGVCAREPSPEGPLDPTRTRVNTTRVQRLRPVRPVARCPVGARSPRRDARRWTSDPGSMGPMRNPSRPRRPAIIVMAIAFLAAGIATADDREKPMSSALGLMPSTTPCGPSSAWTSPSTGGKTTSVYTRRRRPVLKLIVPAIVLFVVGCSVVQRPMIALAPVVLGGSQRLTDAFQLTSAAVKDGFLAVEVSYSGGCRNHEFLLLAPHTFQVLSDSVLLEIALIHDAPTTIPAKLFSPSSSVSICVRSGGVTRRPTTETPVPCTSVSTAIQGPLSTGSDSTPTPVMRAEVF